MDYDSIFEVVRDVIASAAVVEPIQVDPDSDLINDLNLDSLALFEIVIDLEEAFGLQIDDETIESLHTCREIAAFIRTEVERSDEEGERYRERRAKAETRRKKGV